MKREDTLEILENELVRYKEQKYALKHQAYPINQEDSKQLLLNFYTEKIKELQAEIDSKRVENIEVKGAVICSYTPNKNSKKQKLARKNNSLRQAN